MSDVGIQRERHCKNCPFIKPDDGECHGAFFPETLTRTVIRNLEGEKIHKCHSNSKYFCAGFLSFLMHKWPPGPGSSITFRLGVISRIINPDMIKHFPKLFDSVEEMLESHRERTEF